MNDINLDTSGIIRDCTVKTSTTAVLISSDGTLLLYDGRLFLVVLEIFHPLRPVTRSYMRAGPWPIRVELSMPLQCPQFLKSYLPNRVICEKTIDIAPMSINAVTTNLSKSHVKIPIVRWGLIEVYWKTSKEVAIQKKGYV